MAGSGKHIVLILLFLNFFSPVAGAKTLPPNFKVTNEMIYQQLMKLKEEHAVFKEKFNSIEKRFEEIDKRFEQVDKRFEQVDKRFEQVDKRFEELRKDMDIRFKELREDMNRRFEELREDMNKQFTTINDRFDDMRHYLNLITGIFTTLTVFVIGFAYWDRRTIISKAKEETIKELENSGKLRDLILVLREKARTDSELERILKEHKLL
jgi:archaellum component FlaC